MSPQFRAFCIGFLALLFFSAPTKALGFGGFFGTQERIKCIQPIKIKEETPTNQIFTRIDINNPGLTSYNLCYKISIHFFILGVTLHDDGYVIAEGDNAFRYIPLNDAQITEYQEKGILPKPLPEYSIPLEQYLVGYSLWLVLAGLIVSFIIWLVILSLWNRFKAWKYRGKYCLNCNLLLSIKDFTDGKCSACSEPIPN